VQQADIVGDAVPAPGRLPFGDPAELDGVQPVVVGVVAEVETRAVGRGGLLRTFPKKSPPRRLGLTPEGAPPSRG
jgi:hypothetical protein